MSRAQTIIRNLQMIADRAKGWPVGIPVSIPIAKRLQALGYVESAPCGYRHLIKKPVWSVRLTGAGQAHLKVYRDGQQDRKNAAQIQRR